MVYFFVSKLIYHHESHNDLTSYWCSENKKKECPARIMFNNEFQSSKRKWEMKSNEKWTIQLKNKLKRKVNDDPADSPKNSYENVVLFIFFHLTKLDKFTFECSDWFKAKQFN